MVGARQRGMRRAWILGGVREGCGMEEVGGDGACFYWMEDGGVWCGI